MDSGIMARVEVEDPHLTCHDQTGKRCAALLGLTRRGRHPAGRGQLPGSTTGKATTEALAVDAICLPSDMLQDRIWGLSCNAAQLVEGQVEQVGSAYLGG